MTEKSPDRSGGTNCALRTLGVCRWLADVVCRGHAFEARLCAEDADAGFLPATGRLDVVDFSRSGVRIESGVDSGDEISPHYDSMIAKLIAHGSDRESARRALVAGLRESTVIGLVTNLRFLHELLEWPETRDASFHTRLIDERHARRGAAASATPPIDPGARQLHWLAQRRADRPRWAVGRCGTASPAGACQRAGRRGHCRPWC